MMCVHHVTTDKACIDQMNIDESLQSLPVFLSACRQLVVLAGPTYTSRLWCVMELFVFVRMGGQKSDIVLSLLDKVDLTRFDAGNAQCFLDLDRQKLLAVIESSFGTFDPFNKIVRAIFAGELKSDVKSTAADDHSTLEVGGDVTLAA
jgi:hypothetical protein